MYSVYQTYLFDCNCGPKRILFKNLTPCCSWCRKPLVEAGLMNYEEENFQKEKVVENDLKEASQKVIRKGFVQAMDGRELWVNTETDEMIKFFVRDDELKKDLYCRPVTVTFEFGEKP